MGYSKYMNTNCTACQMPSMFCICPDPDNYSDAREACAGETVA